MIFNLWAVLVGLLIVLIGLAVNWISPSLMNGTHYSLVVGIITLGVSGICEFFGIKGRIFFIPIWIIGLGLICYEIGTIGVIVFACIAAAAFYLMMRQSKKREAEAWRKAQLAITSLHGAQANAPTVEFWKCLNEALFLPILTDYTSDMCRHNLKATELALSRAHELNPDETAKFEQLVVFFDENKAVSKPKGLQPDLRTQINDIIEGKIENKKPRASTITKKPSAAASARIPTPPTILATTINLEPQNALEETLSALKYGGIARERALEVFLAAEIIILQNQPSPPAIRPLIAGSSAIVFTSLKALNIQNPEFKYPTTITGRSLINALPPNTGIGLNAGSNLGFQISASEVDQLKQSAKAA